MLRRLLWVGLLLAVVGMGAHAALQLPFPVPPDNSRPPITPSWAFSLWVWEDDVNRAAAVWDLVEGYPRYDIPIGVAMIDSPWSTLYNNFVWDTKRYPEPQRMIDELHRRGLKLVLWMTNMINLRDRQADASGESDEDLYAFAKEKGYLCNDGKPAEWWKGVGGFPDYTNPEAVTWWHGLMDRALRMGVDGWKVDGSSAHFPILGGTGKAGPINIIEYSDQYYRDTYRHLVSRRPHGVTMARSADCGEVGYEGRHSPRDAAPVTWVGDQRHTWDELGILEALKSVFLAMEMGYPVIGSDTGGYQTDPAHPGQMPKTLFVRWAQWNAFMPFFINGGHDEHRPWKFDAQTLDIFRRYAWLHQELVPYWFSRVALAHQGKAPFLHTYPGQWQYGLGEEFLVAPIYQDSPQRTVQLPAGRWHYYWQPSRSWQGPAQVNLQVPLAEFPVLVRAGAIIPMQVSRPYTGVGGKWSAGRLVLDLYPGADGSCALYDERTLAVTRIAGKQGKGDFTLTIGGGPARRYLVRMLRPAAPRVVTCNGRRLAPVAEAKWPAAASGWRHRGDRLWIKLPAAAKYVVTVR